MIINVTEMKIGKLSLFRTNEINICLNFVKKIINEIVKLVGNCWIFIVKLDGRQKILF